MLGAPDNHWAEIKSGKVAYRIVGMPGRDFPKVPDHREATYGGRLVSGDHLAAEGGMAPVTRESGKHRAVVFRWACNMRLRVALSTLADGLPEDLDSMAVL